MKEENKRIRKIETKVLEQCMIADMPFHTFNEPWKSIMSTQILASEASDTSDSEVPPEIHKSEFFFEDLSFNNTKIPKSQKTSNLNKLENCITKTTVAIRKLQSKELEKCTEDEIKELMIFNKKNSAQGNVYFQNILW